MSCWWDERSAIARSLSGRGTDASRGGGLTLKDLEATYSSTDEGPAATRRRYLASDERFETHTIRSLFSAKVRRSAGLWWQPESITI